MLNPNFLEMCHRRRWFRIEKKALNWRIMFCHIRRHERNFSETDKKCTILPQCFGENTHRGPSQDKWLCIEGLITRSPFFCIHVTNQMNRVCKRKTLFYFVRETFSIISSPNFKVIYRRLRRSNFDPKKKIQNLRPWKKALFLFGPK